MHTFQKKLNYNGLAFYNFGERLDVQGFFSSTNVL